MARKKKEEIFEDEYEQTVLGPCSLKQQQVLTDDVTDMLLVGGGAGGGKALRHGEVVLTPEGFVPIENMHIGDKVITPDNKVETVVGVYPQGEVDIYEVKFQDGTKVETCGEHLWQYHITGKGASNSVVGSTLDMKALLDKPKIGRNRSPVVPLCNPVDLPRRGVLSIPAYTLGALLGDGGLTQSTPKFTTEDEFILDRMRDEGMSFGIPQVQEGNAAKTYGVLGILDKMRSVSLAGTNSYTKFIPEAYKYAAIEDRLKLIQGMMDTDGYVSHDGKTYYTTISPTLRDDITFILRSLGFTVTTTSKIGFYTKNGIKIECAEAFTLYIRGNNQPLLFSLPRKCSRTVKKVVGNRVVSVKKVCRDFATCIAITGDEKLFITTGFVVTHNTYLALLKALKYCDDPAARVIIVRLSYPAIKAIGGLVDESQQLYTQFNAEWRVQPLEWRFQNGAVIKFAAMPAKLSIVQGWQATHIIVDEAAEFTLEQILALKNRLRGARCKLKLSMTMTCNPDRNSWLYPFVEYCLNPETGVPKPGTENITRWFVVLNGKIFWGETRESLFAEHGHGYTLGVNFKPTSWRFIPMDIYSNPVLLKNNPDYLASLMAGTRVSQLRFLHGSWTAVPEGSSVFNREWVKIVDHAPINPQSKVRSWDLAHSIKSEVYPDPDYTAGVLMSRTKFGTYCIEDVIRDRRLTDGVVKMIIETSQNIDGLDIPVTIPRDNGGGKAASTFFLRSFAEAGMNCRGIAISGHSSKMQRFLPFCTLAESGCVTMVRAPWNEAFLTELEHFSNTRNQKDDQVDATADAFNILAKQTTIPTFHIPDMSMGSILPTLS